MKLDIQLSPGADSWPELRDGVLAELGRAHV